ncbi:Cytosine-specific methyltransferase [Melia azedarach]|uniref:Cytosine-specific methyltransferase n=1 Tax=Melia azedarach TaxID=155640 RepID=A0ACC1Y373_MELAZ|nr:Cytosine-specific methyltransferase [Melia azedarach]
MSDDSTGSERDGFSIISRKSGSNSPNETSEMRLLDLYSVCCAGLCIGASSSELELFATRKGAAGDFLLLVKEWAKLFQYFSLYAKELLERLLAVCYEHPNKVKKPGMHFKGDVDFICGGPPCQGVSGFNCFRNPKADLEDVKSHHLLLFMVIIGHSKPKYVLMENVVDILKFSGEIFGSLCHWTSCIHGGIMAAASHGYHNFGCESFCGKSQQYPLQTHEVIARRVIPNEFEEITIAYGKKQPCQLEKAIHLGDAISDLPPGCKFRDQPTRYNGIHQWKGRCSNLGNHCLNMEHQQSK